MRIDLDVLLGRQPAAKLFDRAAIALPRQLEGAFNYPDAVHNGCVARSWRVEKGERRLAVGERVMFGRNERSLGVKNGSLGRIESITPTRMAVMLDDGREVAFDHKDYSAINHGYAATVHKTQGVTVDRVHVLATPGLDRHAGYVALSRHREGVELYYGGDDFADDSKLVRTLSRERAKDMASDYARDFADRRQIVLLAPAAEKAMPAPARDQFAGVSLNTGTSEVAQPSKVPALEPSSALPDAVTRHARIVRALQFARSVGEPFTADQRQELSNSRTGLNAIRPHAALDLETALASDPKLTREAADGRTATAIRAMQLEAELRVDPQLRADTFVQRWQALDRQRRMLLRDQEDTRANAVGDRMMGMAKSLERVSQAESILRSRKAQLGLPEMQVRSVGQSLADVIGRGRSRGLRIEM